ncbi:MAG TPA: carboxymuconolactone decarboxylase family protein, partial [Burkholderiales bacterium]|nr:carboxymuconolactone decarboxylase family protein [Burkholderiales bacterium]
TDELFAALRRHWSEGEIVELLGVVAMFGFLNRWNDSMATPLEPVPTGVAEKALGDHGWSAGKHAR